MASVKILQTLALNPQKAFSRYMSKKIKIRSRKYLSEKELSKHFVDWRSVAFFGGKGGNGSISMRREASVEFGGPDGGDGGGGGSIILEARRNVKSLEHIKHEYKGENGENGRKQNCTGRTGKDTIIQVPLGTIIKGGDVTFADLAEDGQQYVVVYGGKGGKGNRRFVSSKVQAPMVATKGKEGQERKLSLELRTIAHAGLIGFPNAGKSSLLRALSRARPKVAAYPFTTLNPHVGIVEYKDFEQVADIPGLIPGAHKNHGLGYSFLRHIERCLCLMYVIDLSVPNPWDQLTHLQFELEQYLPGLSQRPHAIIGNKIDLDVSEENLRYLQEKISLPVIPVSALEETNMVEVKVHLRKLYDEDLGGKLKVDEDVGNVTDSSLRTMKGVPDLRKRII